MYIPTYLARLSVHMLWLAVSFESKLRFIILELNASVEGDIATIFPARNGLPVRGGITCLFIYI